MSIHGGGLTYIAKYYVLNPELRREKDRIGRGGLEVLIVVRLQHVNSAFAEQAAWGKFYWLTGSQ